MNHGHSLLLCSATSFRLYVRDIANVKCDHCITTHTHTQHSLKIYTQIFLARPWQYRWVKGNKAKLDNLPPSLRQISRCVLQSFVLHTLLEGLENGKPATVTALLVLLGDRGHITKESSVSKCPQADWNVFS